MTVNKIILPILSVVFFAAGFAVLNVQPAQAYSNHDLISNQNFRDHNSMSRSQIQSFLNDRGGALASWSGGDAAQIIYDAAQDYGISPKVIMATLQKEQSLITDQSPHHTQYDFAMGYGCPTTGSCSYPGFETQVRYGTWQLRFNYERARGNNSWWNNAGYACGGSTAYYSTGLYPGRSVRFYDHINGQHYATVNIANAATASMYCYTPHVYNPSGNPVYYSGSYNFVTFYEQHWGSTRGGAVSNIHFISCDGQKYLYEDTANRKRLVTDDALKAWGLKNQHFISDSSQCSRSTFELPLERIVRSRNTGREYLVDRGRAYRITSQDVADAWSLGDYKNTTYPQFDGASIHFLRVMQELPRLGKSPNTGKVYLADNGDRYEVTGADSGDTTSLQLVRGYNEVAMSTLSATLLQTLNASDDLDYAFTVNNEWYLLDHNRVRKIKPESVPRWENFLNGPELSNQVLTVFSHNTNIGHSWRRDEYYYHINSEGNLDRTKNSSLANYWGVDDSRYLTRLLTNNKLVSNFGVKSFSGNGRVNNMLLITCGGNKYIAEDNSNRKRLISQDALDHLGDLKERHFNANSSRCSYATFDLSLERVIRSRNTGLVYLINEGNAHLVNDQTEAASWGLNDYTDTEYPMLWGANIHSLNVVRELPSFSPSLENANIRLFKCGTQKYIVERGIRRSRLITSTGIEAWGLANAYFSPEDNGRGCNYSKFDLSLSNVVRSRDTGQEYLIKNSKAYQIQSQEAADGWALGDYKNTTYPQFNQESIQHLETEEELLPPSS